jgi:CP family cyanate transporter-like MFS transporter
MSTGYFLGALVAPWAFGAAADATGGYDASWAGCVAALSGSALCFAAVHRWVALPLAAGSTEPTGASRPLSAAPGQALPGS